MNRDLEIVLLLLEEGKSVELPAVGYSMFPTFWPGQRFVVKPVGDGERLEVGCVVVCQGDGTGHRAPSFAEAMDGNAGQKTLGKSILVMHRLVDIRKNEYGEIIYITKGDVRQEADDPWKKKQLIGIVSGRKIKTGIRKVKCFVPGDGRSKANRILFKIYWRIKWFLQ